MSIGYINLKWAVIIKYYYKISSSIIPQFISSINKKLLKVSHGPDAWWDLGIPVEFAV